ncbi:zinc finger protein 431-like [Ostrinia nubilalis]|uniref:zinc finger protein 431-like n=1 Tax=Ostrinia nubilalis TaxID=29057 RepID=UPI0030824B8B
MSNIKVCRICLGHNTPMYTVTATNLHEFYEKNTNKPLKTDEELSVACYICYHLLKKCYRFIQCAIKANEVLQKISNDGTEITEKAIALIDKPHSFRIFQNTPIDCVVSTEVEENIEVPIVKDEHLDIKREPALDTTSLAEDEKDIIEPPLPDDSQSFTDSEDDVPLKCISRKTETQVKNKRPTKAIRPIKKVKKAPALIDAREIVLSLEEQRAQLLARAQSLNYLHSPHRCTLCYKGFVDLKAYENHKEKHDERSGPFECEICRMRYRTSRHLRTHVHTCHGRQYACNKCAHRSHTANQAREHEKWHNGYTYECQLCSQKFRKPTSYLTHMRKRHPTEHVCNICGDSFVGRHGLLMHRSHLFSIGGKPTSYLTHMRKRHPTEHVCNICGDSFVGRHGLLMKPTSYLTHMRKRHPTEHVCNICGDSFVGRHGLGLKIYFLLRKPTSYLTHMRKRHPTEHVCNICGDSFVGRHGLLMHKSKAHRLQEKPTPEQEPKFCADCNIQFVSLDAWKRHIMSSAKHAVATDASTLCHACDTRVPGSKLREHLRSHEAERERAPPNTAANVRAAPRAPCSQCGANFVNRSKLQAHIKRIHLGVKYNKNIVCEVCGKKCTSNASLKYHQRTHTGERPFACSHCGKRFADNNQRRIHVRTHTGERPYCCAACGKRFSQKPALNRHYRVHTGAKPYDCQFCAKTFSQSNSLKLHVNTVHLKIPRAVKKQPAAADA